MIQIIGWASSLCFIAAPFPQVLQCYRQGHARGLSKAMMWIYLVGESCLTTYGIWGLNVDMPVVCNGAMGLVWALSMLRYAYWPRNKEIIAYDMILEFGSKGDRDGK